MYACIFFQGTTISFEKTNYTIDESAGEVIVDIVVETGVLLGAVVIAVQTRDGTAKGMKFLRVYVQCVRN